MPQNEKDKTMKIAAQLADKMADHAHTFCTKYLSAGAKFGHYWVVGDARNTKGGSLYVRLTDGPQQHAGRWRDAGRAGGSGDLLNILAIQKGSMSAAIEEATRFVGGEGVVTPIRDKLKEADSKGGDTTAAARRLLEIGKSIRRTHTRRAARRRRRARRRASCRRCCARSPTSPARSPPSIASISTPCARSRPTCAT
jgi:hypothetical protein